MRLTRLMLRIFYTFVLFVCSSLVALAQVSISARVLDASKEPLPFANVRLLNSKGKMQTGQATGQDGNFRLSNVPEGTYILEVSYVGYTSHRDSLSLKRGNHKLKDIVLQEAGELKELTVVGKVTEVAVKGDTIEYNAGSYATSEGSPILELLKKLPGAEVDEEGNVKVNGKDVSKIMVDGKRFFENDPKVALKNLPAELVDKIQVHSRESDNARLTGFSDGDDETVINLTIKPGRKKGLFGTAFAGAGTQSRYEASAMLNRFNDKQQWSILGGLNNTNNAGFTDIASDLSRSDLAQMASGSRRRPWQRNDGGDGITISRMLGGNLIMKIGGESQIGGNATLGNSEKNLISKSQTTNIQSSGNTIDQGETIEQNTKWNAGSNIRLEWKPNNRTELILSPRLNYGTNRGTYLSRSSSSLEQGGQITDGSLQQNSDSRVFDTGVDLDFSRRLSASGRTLVVGLDARLTGNEQSTEYQSETHQYATNTTTLSNQKQQQDEGRKQFTARINYVEPLTKGLLLQLSYRLKGDFSSTTRSVYDYNQASSLYDVLNTASSYELQSQFYAHRAGFALKHATSTLDLTAGLNVDPSSLHTTRQYAGQEYVIDQKVVNYSPTLRFSYKPSKAFNLRLNYRGESFQPTANQLSPINDNSNPLVQYVGNENLRPGFRHNMFGDLSLFSASKQSSLNLFAMFNLTENNIISTSKYDTTTGVRTLSYDNVNGNWGFNLGGFYTTPLWGKRFSLRLSSRNSLSNSVGFSNDERNVSKTMKLTEEVSLSYRYGSIDTSLKGVWTHSRTRNTLEALASSTTNDYGIHWDSNIKLPLGLTFESDLKHTWTRGYASGYDYDQTLVNLSLSYSFLKGNAATIRFKVYDLLAQQRNVFRSETALAINTQETNIIGRYAMLHFIYKFSSFSSNASASDMQQMGGRRGGPSGGTPPPGRF